MVISKSWTQRIKNGKKLHPWLLEEQHTTERRRTNLSLWLQEAGKLTALPAQQLAHI
jgi:hypothetical protein